MTPTSNPLAGSERLHQQRCGLWPSKALLSPTHSATHMPAGGAASARGVLQENQMLACRRGMGLHSRGAMLRGVRTCAVRRRPGWPRRLRRNGGSGIPQRCHAIGGIGLGFSPTRRWNGRDGQDWEIPERGRRAEARLSTRSKIPRGARLTSTGAAPECDPWVRRRERRLPRRSATARARRQTLNTAPPSALFDASIVPPCCSMISRVMARPRPVPPAPLFVLLLCTNLSKISSSSDSGMPMP